jgi:hypothetical protein
LEETCAKHSDGGTHTLGCELAPISYVGIYQNPFLIFCRQIGAPKSHVSLKIIEFDVLAIQLRPH